MVFKIYYKSARCIKHMKMNLILGIALTVSQVSVSSTLGVYHSQLDLQKSPTPSSFNSSLIINSLNLDKRNSDEEENPWMFAIQNFEVQQEIDALNSRIVKFIESMRKDEMPKIRKSKLDSKCKNESDSRLQRSGSFLSTLDSSADLAYLEKMKEVIGELKNSSGINGNITDQLNALQESVQTMSHLLDSTIAELWCRTGELRELIKVFTEKVNGFGDEINIIKERVDVLNDPAKQRRLRAEIVREIKDRMYDSALKKLEDLAGNFTGNVNYIVHEVYDNEEGNFDLILRLGNRAGSATVSLAVYQALNFEMRNANHKNDSMLLMLIDSLKNHVIDKRSVSAEELVEAKALKYELHNEARDVMIPELSSLLINNSYERLEEMFEKIDAHDPPLFNDVFKPALQLNFRPIDLNRLVSFFKTFRHKGQALIGCSATFFELKERNILDNNTAVIKLAFIVKKLLPEFADGSEEYQAGERMKDALPKSVRNLVFSSRVCFYSVLNKEYMYAAGFYDHFGYQRSVFSQNPSKIAAQSYWLIEPHPREDDYYYIKNIIHNEYLYSSTSKYDELATKAHVFTTWVIYFTDNREYKWSFESSGDVVYIRNNYFNEYLFADQTEYDYDSHYVFTWTNGSKTSECQWIIENCD